MLEVLKPGFHSLIQDSGRFGYQEFGMPVSGALDFDSYRLANWLVGNPIDTEVLEITLIGPSLKFHKEAVVGITGAAMSPKVDGISMSMNRTFCVPKGGVLSFGDIKNGCRTYLSVAGGFGLEKEMGSRSTYSYANLGGLNGSALKKGDFFNLDLFGKVALKIIPNEFCVSQNSMMPIRVVRGPEFDVFSKKDIDLFYQNEFTITPNSSRMGVRLEGVVLASSMNEMISSGVVNGTIQVPSSGEPIVLLSEAQTTGGYPRIANVIKSDLPILAQQKPGSRIRFREVSMEQAQAVHSNKENNFLELINS